MTISYKPLWKLLVEKDLKKKDLSEIAGLCNVTISRLTKGESVTTDSLLKICIALDCRIEDIMEVVPRTNIGEA